MNLDVFYFPDWYKNQDTEHRLYARNSTLDKSETEDLTHCGSLTIQGRLAKLNSAFATVRYNGKPNININPNNLQKEYGLGPDMVKDEGIHEAITTELKKHAIIKGELHLRHFSDNTQSYPQYIAQLLPADGQDISYEENTAAGLTVKEGYGVVGTIAVPYGIIAKPAQLDLKFKVE